MNQQHFPDLSPEMSELLRLAEFGDAILNRTKNIRKTLKARASELRKDGKLPSPWPWALPVQEASPREQ